MADLQIGNLHGVAAVSAGDSDTKTNLNGGTAVDTPWDDTDLATLAAMRTRLAAIDAGYYTAARLNNMTFNDMVYAIRVADSASTVR